MANIKFFIKITLSIIFSIISIEVNSQNLYNLIKENNYDEVKKYTKDVNVLLDNEVDNLSKDIFFPIDNEATPLMYAIYLSDLKMVKLLINKGANPQKKGIIPFSYKDEKFSYGSCLVIAAGEGKLDILKYLLKLGIPVDEKENESKFGWTALQWASIKGNTKIVKYLIKKGAKVNSYDSKYFCDEYFSLLLFALKYKHFKTAELLIKLGADVNLFNNNWKSPLGVAYENNNKSLMKLLKEKGAKMYFEPAMNVKKRVLLRNDSIAKKHFSKKEIMVLEIFLSKIDSFILDNIATEERIKTIYKDSLISKLKKHNKQTPEDIWSNVVLFTNHKYNLDLIKKLNLTYKNNQFWEINTHEAHYYINNKKFSYKEERINNKRNLSDFFVESLFLNNNLSDYIEFASAIGDPKGYAATEFIHINELLDRDRLSIYLILFNASFPEYYAPHIIKKYNMDKDINDIYYKYKDAIQNKKSYKD